MSPNNRALGDLLVDLVRASTYARDLKSITTYYRLHRRLSHNPKPALRQLPGILLNEYFPTRQDLNHDRLVALSMYDGHTWSQMADALRKHVHDHPRFAACIECIVSHANHYPQAIPTVAVGNASYSLSA